MKASVLTAYTPATRGPGGTCSSAAAVGEGAQVMAALHGYFLAQIKSGTTPAVPARTRSDRGYRIAIARLSDALWSVSRAAGMTTLRVPSSPVPGDPRHPVRALRFWSGPEAASRPLS